jgi:hypothetical protein
MPGITLHRLDQVGNQVASPLEGGFDIGPGLKYRFFLDLQRVVSTAAKQKKGEKEQGNSRKALHDSSCPKMKVLVL